MTVRCNTCGSKTTDIIIRLGYAQKPKIIYNGFDYTYSGIKSFKDDLATFVQERIMIQRPD